MTEPAIVLDALYMTDRETAHEYLAEMLALPDYYGKNLDALWDLLCEPCEPFTVTLLHSKALPQQLGGYGEAMLDVFRDASEENGSFTWIEA